MWTTKNYHIHKLHATRISRLVKTTCLWIPHIVTHWLHPVDAQDTTFAREKDIHTNSGSAIPDSNSWSLAARLVLADVSLLDSFFKLLKSVLYSLNLARRVAFALGDKLLASRSIFWSCSNSRKITLVIWWDKKRSKKK